MKGWHYGIEIDPIPHHPESRKDDDVLSVPSRNERTDGCNVSFVEDVSPALGGGCGFSGNRGLLFVGVLSTHHT